MAGFGLLLLVSPGASYCWDRGRLARNEREARKTAAKDCAPDGAFAGGSPAVPANHLTHICLHGSRSKPRTGRNLKCLLAKSRPFAGKTVKMLNKTVVFS